MSSMCYTQHKGKCMRVLVLVIVVVYAACLWRDYTRRARLESRSVLYCDSPSQRRMAPSIRFSVSFALELND